MNFDLWAYRGAPFAPWLPHSAADLAGLDRARRRPVLGFPSGGLSPVGCTAHAECFWALRENGHVLFDGCLVLIAQLLLVPLSAREGSQTPDDYLRRGEESAGAHDWNGAIADYNIALALRPDYAEAYKDRGHAYYWTHDYARAIADFTRAIELRPNYPHAFNNRGAAWLASGISRERAIADFDQAIRLKPDFRNAYVNRANAREFRHWRQALDDFHQAGMHPERAFALGLCGMLLAGAGGFILHRRRRSRRAWRVIRRDR